MAPGEGKRFPQAGVPGAPYTNLAAVAFAL